MDNLISMVDYCQEVSKEFMAPKKPFDKNEWFGKILNYSDFLKQPLCISMFVPAKKVDGVWVILEEPMWQDEYEKDKVKSPCLVEKSKEYQEAKDNCLFELFELDGKYLWHKEDLFMISDNIQDSFDGRKIEFLLSYYKQEITLTESAKKQIGL